MLSKVLEKSTTAGCPTNTHQAPSWKRKSYLEIFRKMKGFVLDNYLESKKIPLAVKTEEGEEDDFFVTF